MTTSYCESCNTDGRFFIGFSLMIHCGMVNNGFLLIADVKKFNNNRFSINYVPFSVNENQEMQICQMLLRVFHLNINQFCIFCFVYSVHPGSSSPGNVLLSISVLFHLRFYMHTYCNYPFAATCSARYIVVFNVSIHCVHRVTKCDCFMFSINCCYNNNISQVHLIKLQFLCNHNKSSLKLRMILNKH